MPEWVLADEQTMVGLNVAALLDARLTVSDGDILEPHIMLFKQGTLAPESLVFD